MFSRTVAENRKASSETSAISRRSELEVDVAHVDAVDQHAPAVGSYRRGTSDTSVVLPDPLAPTTATVRPAGDVEVDPAQHRGSPSVGELDAAQLDPPVALGQPGRARRGGQPGARSRISNTRAPEATARWAMPERDAEHPHRPGQHQHVAVEGDELADADRAR